MINFVVKCYRTLCMNLSDHWFISGYTVQHDGGFNSRFIRESSLIFHSLLNKHSVNKDGSSISHLLTKVNALKYKTCSVNADRIYGEDSWRHLEYTSIIETYAVYTAARYLWRDTFSCFSNMRYASSETNEVCAGNRQETEIRVQAALSSSTLSRK